MSLVRSRRLGGSWDAPPTAPHPPLPLPEPRYLCRCQPRRRRALPANRMRRWFLAPPGARQQDGRIAAHDARSAPRPRSPCLIFGDARLPPPPPAPVGLACFAHCRRRCWRFLLRSAGPSKIRDRPAGDFRAGAVRFSRHSDPTLIASRANDRGSRMWGSEIPSAPPRGRVHRFVRLPSQLYGSQAVAPKLPSRGTYFWESRFPPHLSQLRPRKRMKCQHPKTS